VVVITTLGDWITSILIVCFRISTTTTFDTLDEIEFIRVWWCPILWLHIGILYGAECGCEYTSSTLRVIWMDGQIYRLCGPNWSLDSIFFNLLWITKYLSSWSYDWSINAPITFYNSTCLAIPTLMWKCMTGQFMIACPSSSQNA
jgi:hypothetical protein